MRSIVILFCVGLAPLGALAQTAEVATDAKETQPDLSSERGGSSLLRASLKARDDSGQAQLKDVSFFSVPVPEPRTLKKHDLVTVIVREESEYSSEAQTDLKKDASIDATLDQFIKIDLNDMELKPAIGSVTPRIRMSGQRDFKGEGTVERSDSFIARITAEVIDVKPNGTIVLQARKTIRTDDEEQMVILSGICRAEDVLTDNTVLSTQLYDLELTKNHKGAIRDNSKRGLIPKLLDVINPF